MCFGRNKLNQTCMLGAIFTKEYIIFLFSIAYAIPLIIMLIMYTKIGIIARKHRREIASLQIPATQPTPLENNREDNSSNSVLDPNRPVRKSDGPALIKKNARS